MLWRHLMVRQFSAAKPRRLSGAQREVLSLFREYCRVIRSKEVPLDDKRRMIDHVKGQFREAQKTIRRTEFERAEAALRRGQRSLVALRVSPTGFHVAK
mmetsp:Transcript_7926/g.25351  ORF Transcript_7926/g.25351 Transcript_7926/m.25351 type:complete len:99 (-) Transcript_7926:602-898(-)